MRCAVTITAERNSDGTLLITNQSERTIGCFRVLQLYGALERLPDAAALLPEIAQIRHVRCCDVRCAAVD
jgi:hypothetical protein